MVSHEKQAFKHSKKTVAKKVNYCVMQSDDGVMSRLI